MNRQVQVGVETSKREIRTFQISELRVNDTDAAATPTIEGYAAVFNVPSEDLGGFREQIRPGTFKKTISEADIRALQNHDPNYVLGRNVAGTLLLKEDIHGLRVSISPPDTTWARDLMVSMKRGDVNQMSFAFETLRDEWSIIGEEVNRYLTEVRLFDVSVVTFPAYTQTTAEARSKAESLKQPVAPDPVVHPAVEVLFDEQELVGMLDLLAIAEAEI